MRTQRKMIGLGLVALLLVSTGCSSSGGRSSDEAILTSPPAPKYEPRQLSLEERARLDSSARVGGRFYLGLIQPEQLTQFGFTDVSEFARVEPGEPIEMVFLWGDGESPGSDPTLISAGEMRVPLMVDGVNRVFLTLEEGSDLDGRATWSANAIGAAELATLIQGEPAGTILFRNTVLQRDYLLTPDLTRPQGEWSARPIESRLLGETPAALRLGDVLKQTRDKHLNTTQQSLQF